MASYKGRWFEGNGAHMPGWFKEHIKWIREVVEELREEIGVMKEEIAISKIEAKVAIATAEKLGVDVKEIKKKLKMI